MNAPFDCLCNGSFTYSLRGVHCRVSVVWNFQATAGAGDTSHSLLRGTKAEVLTRQGPAEGYRPVLYARPRRADDAGFEAALRSALASLSAETPGLACERAGDEGLWRITYPERYEVSHEEQFALVLEDFLRQVDGGRPDADGIDNLIVKYHTLVEAWKTAHGGDAAAFEASPAWELYGKRGLVSNGFPKPGEARQDGCVSYHLRKGGHDLVAEDWRRFADFAERHGWLKGK